MVSAQRRSYEELGLFWNPFGEPEPERWAELIVSEVDLDALAERLRSPSFALVFRGDAGRGKSTHLRALHARFPGLPWTYLGPHASPRTRVPWAPVRFVDEAQRLAPGVRRRLYCGGLRGRAALAMTSHEDLCAELEAAGYEVEERTIAGLDVQQLEAIVRARVDWAARPGAQPELVERRLLEQLINAHGDDLRTILDRLYGHVESLRRP